MEIEQIKIKVEEISSLLNHKKLTTESRIKLGELDIKIWQWLQEVEQLAKTPSFKNNNNINCGTGIGNSNNSVTIG